MKKIPINDLKLWQFENLSKENGIRHFVTDRQSLEGGKPFTLSFSSSPDADEIRYNRKMLATAMGVAEGDLYFPSQVHETKIVEVTSDTSKQDVMETDALITRQRGICIAVMSADCVPILLYDHRNNAVAAVHSGWRGTVKKILTKTLLMMQTQFGTQGEDIVAGIGPSVSQPSYEVGEEVIVAVEQAFGRESALMVRKENKKANLDLWLANKNQLLDFGVKESAIEISDLCTVINNESFFSARKGDAGRFAAGIMLR
jgi:YfiH family protein